MKTETHSTTTTRPTLPINRAFIVQFRGKADLTRGIISGWIEHVQSGQAEKVEGKTPTTEAIHGSARCVQRFAEVHQEISLAEAAMVENNHPTPDTRHPTPKPQQRGS
jgi:hypothetical protein